MSAAPRYQALLSIGADIDPQQNVPAVVALLAARFDVVATSPVYESPALLPDGTIIEGRSPFWNLALRVATDLPYPALREACRCVEEAVGRRRTADRLAPRVADIDIVFGDPRLTVSSDGVLPAADLLDAPHVLIPAADVWSDAAVASGTLEDHARRVPAEARGMLRRQGTVEELR